MVVVCFDSSCSVPRTASFLALMLGLFASIVDDSVGTTASIRLECVEENVPRSILERILHGFAVICSPILVKDVCFPVSYRHSTIIMILTYGQVNSCGIVIGRSIQLTLLQLIRNLFSRK